MKSAASHLPVVLLHGLLSTPQEFGLIALSMRSRGIDLRLPQIPGYTLGEATGPRRRSRWQDWSAAAAEAVAQAVPNGQPFVLGGLCAGGLLAAALTLQGQHNVAALALLSPTFDYDGWGQSHWRHLRRLAYALGLDRWISVAERDPYGIKNPKIRRWVAREMAERAASAAGPSRLPLWAIHEVDRLKDVVRERLPELSLPTLVMHARDDEICSLASVESAMRSIGTHDTTLVVLENSYHMITIDNDRHQVVSELMQLSRRLAASAQVPAAACHQPNIPPRIPPGRADAA